MRREVQSEDEIRDIFSEVVFSSSMAVLLQCLLRKIPFITV